MIKFFLDIPASPDVDLRLERRTGGASGYDLMANITMPRQIEVGRRWLCNTGLYLEMPPGVEAQVRSRSGLCRDHGVFVLNAPGTVDCDYRGEIQVTLQNAGERAYTVIPGERVAQLVFCPVFVDGVGTTSPDGIRHDTVFMQGGLHRVDHIIRRVASRDEFSDTTRGTSGHGSTGR